MRWLAALLVCALPHVAAAEPACGPEKNHCIRPETRFWIDDVRGGQPVPVHKVGDDWVTYDEEHEKAVTGSLARTEPAVKGKLKRDEEVIVWQPWDDEPPFPSSEKEAQTPKRWVSMTIYKLAADGKTFVTEGREDKPIPVVNARRIVELVEIKR